MFKLTCVMISLIFVTACSGDGGARLPVADPLTGGDVQERLVRFEAMTARVAGFDGTPFAEVPTTGSADFKGIGTVEIDQVTGQAGDEITLVGFVELDADFARDRVIGQMRDIEGHTGGRPRDRSVFDTTGSIQIGNTTSDLEDGVGARTNRFTANYVGSIVTPEGRVDLSGTLDGLFRGARPVLGPSRVISGFIASDEDGSASVGGRAADQMSIDLVGLN